MIEYVGSDCKEKRAKFLAFRYKVVSFLEKDFVTERDDIAFEESLTKVERKILQYREGIHGLWRVVLNRVGFHEPNIKDMLVASEILLELELHFYAVHENHRTLAAFLEETRWIGDE